MGYTAQFGNGLGVRSRLKRRARRRSQMKHVVRWRHIPLRSPSRWCRPVWGFQAPDIVANLRVDQAWGSAQIMGALHQVNAAYYDYYTVGALTPASGHPDDKLGFVIGAGIKLNAPMVGQGDYFQAQVNYTQGALRYVFQTPNTNWAKVQGRDQRLRSFDRRGLCAVSLLPPTQPTSS